MIGRNLRYAAILVTILVIFLSIATFTEVFSEKEPIRYVGPTKFYANYSSACIFRVDDFVADPSEIYNITFHIGSKNITLHNYQMDLINYLLTSHPEARLVFGVITGDLSGENNSELWSLYSVLVKEYGWEAASHTRYHLLPPRSTNDILGSIRDIEGNITGYKVLTYIPPYGKTDKKELGLLKEAGVKIIMSDKPFQFREPAEWSNLHITLKISPSIPWVEPLKILHSIENRIGGIMVIYTHATSFDWKNSRQLEDAFNTALSVVEDGRTWITVPSELYKYYVERNNVQVYLINGNQFKIELRKAIDFQPIPITFKFIVDREVKAVYFNNSAMPELDSFGYIPKVGYKQIGNTLLVSVLPNGTLEVLFSGGS
ncbi:MAG: hypothetical protein QW333_06395 [Fervidicoccaceae archaeon]